MSKFSDEIKLYMERSVTDLHAAKEFLETGQYNSAASRASESAFHTASALLLDEEIETGKPGDVLPLIQEVFVNRRRLTQEQGEKLNWLFQLASAESSDASVPLIEGEAQKAVEFAESFFEAGKVILEA
jgi:uncharacterized protein (UPF0332 family)